MLFDDGFVKILKGHRISKSSPLFDPIKSSKQDRREKKRKINVAQLFKKKPRMSNPDDKPKKLLSSDNTTTLPKISNITQNLNVSQLSNRRQDIEPVSEINANIRNPNWKIQ